MQVSMTVNGEQVTREIEGRLLLVHFLRDHLGLTGTHWGCDTSNCGTCVVWMDGEPVKSCTVLAAMAGGHEVRTVEGLEQDGELDPVQQGFMECHGLQCGFCTPGHDDDRAGPARPQPRPDRRRDPRGDLRARSAGAPATRRSCARSSGRRAEQAGTRSRRRRRGAPVMTTVEDRPATEFEDNDQKPVGYGRMLRKEDPRFIRGRGPLRRRHPAARACCTWRSCARRWRTPGSSASTPRRPQAHPKVKARRHRRDARRARAWPGCRPCPTTCRPCSPPTRCASRARRSRSSSPRTATPPATRSN